MSIWTKDSRGHLVSSPNPLEIGAFAGIVAFALLIWLCNLIGFVGAPRMIRSAVGGLLVFAVVAKAIWPKGTAGTEAQEPIASPPPSKGK